MDPDFRFSPRREPLPVKRFPWLRVIALIVGAATAGAFIAVKALH